MFLEDKLEDFYSKNQQLLADNKLEFLKQITSICSDDAFEKIKVSSNSAGSIDIQTQFFPTLKRVEAVYRKWCEKHYFEKEKWSYRRGMIEMLYKKFEIEDESGFNWGKAVRFFKISADEITEVEKRLYKDKELN